MTNLDAHHNLENAKRTVDAELRRTNIVISGELRSWAEARQIDFTKLATRGRYSTLF